MRAILIALPLTYAFAVWRRTWITTARRPLSTIAPRCTTAPRHQRARRCSHHTEGPRSRSTQTETSRNSTFRARNQSQRPGRHRHFDAQILNPPLCHRMMTAQKQGETPRSFDAEAPCRHRPRRPGHLSQGYRKRTGAGPRCFCGHPASRAGPITMKGGFSRSTPLPAGQAAVIAAPDPGVLMRVDQRGTCSIRPSYHHLRGPTAGNSPA